MEIQLDHSKSEKQGDVPVFTPALGVDALHEYARKNKEELENLGRSMSIKFLNWYSWLKLSAVVFSSPEPEAHW